MAPASPTSWPKCERWVGEIDLALYQRLKRRQAEVFVNGDLPDELIADIAAAEYEAGPQ